MASLKEIQTCTIGRDIVSIGHNLLATTQSKVGIAEAVVAITTLAHALAEVHGIKPKQG